MALTRWSCDADGPDGSTSCPEGGARGQFRTPNGFDGYEIYATGVRETFAPKRTSRRTRGPLFALHLSDGETVRVLLADADGTTPAQRATLRAILDTVRTWGKPPRRMPQVVELSPLARAPGNRLLTYGHPTSAEARLAPGATTFLLRIFYGTSIDPATFNAVLDGANVSSRFSPAPGQHELVPLPVRPGSNTLVLSVDGTTGGGRPLTDTDRLVFVVE